MVDYTAILTDFRKKLRAIPGYIGDGLMAWEDREFTPPNPVDKTTIWIQEALIPISEILVATNLVEARGFIQYTINTVEGLGSELSRSYPLLVADHFKPATSIQGVYDIAIDRCERAKAVIQKPWRMLPIRILWRTYASNP